MIPDCRDFPQIKKILIRRNTKVKKNTEYEITEHLSARHKKNGNTSIFHLMEYLSQVYFYPGIYFAKFW